MSRVLGPRQSVMPAFINIGQRLEGVGENEELKAFTTAGFFGSEFGPMNLPYPEEAALAVRPPKGMEPGRFSSRYEHFKRLVAGAPGREFTSDYHQESMLRSMENAHRLLSAKEREAFDIGLEPKEVQEQYDTGRFGRGCLLARRLVENGARYVEVTTEYVPFLHWDTHDNGHETVDRLHKEIDRPIATLIRDLEARGLLDRTLVVIASEFSRDMITEGRPGSKASDQANSPKDFLQLPNHYGQHRHFTGGSTVALFGGGVKKGFVYGKTGRRTALPGGGESGHNQRPACHDLHGHGNQSQDGVRYRGPPLLRHRRWPRQTGRSDLRLKRLCLRQRIRVWFSTGFGGGKSVLSAGPTAERLVAGAAAAQRSSSFRRPPRLRLSVHHIAAS